MKERVAGSEGSSNFPMTATIHTFVLLLVVLAAVAVVARRVGTAPSILLVIVGVVVGLVPGLPRVQLAPEFVLLVLLPPIIYSAGVLMSWREFRFNLRPIGLLAFGCVVFSSVAVASAVHWLFGWPWAVGFLLGAIVSPPDVVAPLALARPLNVPRRLLVVLEGEGLANDATALILYRFAVVAILTGAFSPLEAAGTFGLIVAGEIAYGIGIGWIGLRLRRWAGDPRVEIVLSVITPYAAFLVPQYLGGSGVLATIAAGLYVSWYGPLLISSPTRLQGIFFWDLIIYVIEGFVFLLTGLQARTLLESADTASWRQLIVITAATTIVLVAARFAWVFPAVYLPRWLSPSLARRDPAPPWQWPFFLAFTGVRGVVSLAAALAIPLTLANGAPFPNRGPILVITFGVIIATLVGMGSLLPTVIRWLGLARGGSEERMHERESELNARFEAIDVAQRRLLEIASERSLPEEVTAVVSDYHDMLRSQFPTTIGDGISPPPSTMACAWNSSKPSGITSTACSAKAALPTSRAAASSGSWIWRKPRWSRGARSRELRVAFARGGARITTAPRSFGRIEIVLPGIQHRGQCAQADIELIHCRSRQRQPYGVRRMAGRDGEGRRGRQRNVAPGRGSDEGLRAPVRRQRQPQMIGFFVRLDFESRKTIGRQFLTRARIEALQSRKLGNDAVAHHPLQPPQTQIPRRSIRPNAPRPSRFHAAAAAAR